jgi:tight adherence protein C
VISVRWAIAAGYVASGTLLAGGLMGRADPRVLRRLGVARTEGRASILGWTGRWVRLHRARARVAQRLSPDAGPAAIDRVLGRKAAAAALGVWTALLVSPVPPLALPFGILLGAAGWRLPDFVLARRVRAGRRRAEAAIPELLDLVAVSVTAGLTPRLALARAGRALTGPLALELEDARRSVELGGSWSAALRRTAERLDLRDLGRLSSTLERSARLGAPVADRLRSLAREVRVERRARQEERARRTPVIMLFPLVFLILPAFVLAAVVPTILVATHGIR